jgi:DNA-binding NarL/FixJ family response regulator
MNHWIIDRDPAPLQSWVEAFPQLKILHPGEINTFFNKEPGVLWCRRRAKDTADSVLQQLHLCSGQFVVVLADEPDDSIVSEALALGASGCCNTYAASEVLRQVALVVQNGGLWIGQEMLRRLVGGTSRILGARSVEQRKNEWSSVLSDRETQVARLVASGASNREIAGKLSITERTVKAHLSAVFEKLGLRDRLQLTLRINGLDVRS